MLVYLPPVSDSVVIAELIQNYLEVGEYTFDFVVVFLGVSVTQSIRSIYHLRFDNILT